MHVAIPPPLTSVSQVTYQTSVSLRMGDSVLEEVIARLLAHKAVASLDPKGLGIAKVEIPMFLQPARQFRLVLGAATSNANLNAVRSTG